MSAPIQLPGKQGQVLATFPTLANRRSYLAQKDGTIFARYLTDCNRLHDPPLLSKICVSLAVSRVITTAHQEGPAHAGSESKLEDLTLFHADVGPAPDAAHKNRLKSL